jgi:hypothetical protein
MLTVKTIGRTAMFGFIPTPPPLLVAGGGLFLLVLTVFQMLVGYRKIHFKGRTHLKAHKWVAWVLVVAAIVHGLAGLLYLGIIG